MPVIVFILAIVLLPVAAWAAPKGVCNDGRATDPCVVYVGTNTEGDGSDCDGGDTGTSGCDYTTCAAAEDAIDDFLSQPGDEYSVDFRLYPVTGGDANCTISGWTTTAAYDLTVGMPTSEQDKASTAFGVVDTALHYFDNWYGINIYEDYVTLDGFQADTDSSCNGGDWGVGIALQGASNAILVSNGVVDMDDCTGSNDGILINDTDSNVILENVVVYGAHNASSVAININNANSVTIYNSTVSDSNVGFWINGSASATIYNSVSNDPEFGSEYDFYDTSSGSFSGDYNATSSNDPDNPGSNGQDSFTETDEFVGPNSTPPDFRIKSGASVLPDNGNSGYSYGDPDILGTSRCGTSWDIGAYELECDAGAARRIFLVH